MRYLALLRGINVGGNNKVAMTELKTCFEAAGLGNTHTYINSGNIFFDSKLTDEVKLVKLCEKAIKDQFGFDVVVMVISKTNYKRALKNAPSWWGSGDRQKIRNDALFVIPPTTSAEVIKELNVKTDGQDKLEHSGQVVFWTLPMAAYNKSVVPKMIGTPIYRRVTMRSSTTTNKLLALFDN